MNKKYFIILIAVLTLASVSSLFSAELKSETGDDVDAMELRSIEVEGWESDVWDAKASPAEPVGRIETKIIEGSPENLSTFDSSNKRSMGMRFHFAYQGYNSVIIEPKTTIRRSLGQLNEKNEAAFVDVKGVALPGNVKAISLWVLGRGNKYTLETWIEDWRGETHILKFGSIDFIGWRPLTVQVPTNIPQDIDSYPQSKNLILKKFIIRSTPNSGKDAVIVFIDSLKVLTDLYQMYFDGEEIDFDQKDREAKDKMRKYQKQLKGGVASSGGTPTNKRK
ncbi:MAG: flagellar filament outer layer protein FlaA [Spirochaetia bacterium]|nr:flagellar filament outer layer protein FlaA [Spirochaetia bacterium]